MNSNITDLLEEVIAAERRAIHAQAGAIAAQQALADAQRELVESEAALAPLRTELLEAVRSAGADTPRETAA